MPCVAPARGVNDVRVPFNDAINNNPCGQTVVTNAGGVAFADNLCLFHLMFKYGQAAVNPPYTRAA